jgi:HSP20 family molecular chaperone IbpA
MFSDIFTNIEKRSDIAKKNGFSLKVKPVVDVYETKDSIILLVEMPQVDKSVLKVEIENGILHIEGKKQDSPTEGQLIYRESADVLYERYFEIEENLDSNRIEASYNAGVLKLSLPKKEEAQPRKIQIK